MRNYIQFLEPAECCSAVWNINLATDPDPRPWTHKGEVFATTEMLPPLPFRSKLDDVRLLH